MLEQLLIFTRGGLILWTCKEFGNALRSSPIDTLIRSCLLEERSRVASYDYDVPGASYTLKWTFHNELGLVFVAVYQRILHLLYVDELLSMVKQEFSGIYDPKRTSYDEFDAIFQQMKREAEARAEEMKKSKQVSKPVNNNLGRKQGQTQNGIADPVKNETPSTKTSAPSEGASPQPGSKTAPKPPSGPVSEDEIRAVLVQKTQVTTLDLVAEFKSRLKCREDKDAFAAVLRRISKIHKTNGANYVVLKDK